MALCPRCSGWRPVNSVLPCQQCLPQRVAHHGKFDKDSTFNGSGKFRSGRDAVLHTMEMEQWATESDGDVEAPTGAFAYMTNTFPELPSIIDAFRDAINENMVAHGERLRDLVGHFLLLHNGNGGFTVVTYHSEISMQMAYADLARQYSQWLES